MKLPVFFLLLTSLFSVPCAAQHYKVEALNTGISESVRATDLTSNGYMLLEDVSRWPRCAVLNGLGSKESVRLCDKGLIRAYAVNTSGTVAGAALVNGIYQPATWNKRRGLRFLGKMEATDTEGFAFDINDRGEVVGYTGRKVDVPVFYDEDFDQTYDEGERLYTSPVLDPTAFRWTPNRGMKKAFTGYDGSSSIAGRINNKGQVLGIISSAKRASLITTPVDDYELFEPYPEYRAYKAESSGRTRRTLHDYPVEYGEYSFMDLPKLLAIGPRGDYGIEGWWYKNRGAASYPAGRFTGGRSDYGFKGPELNNRGHAAGVVNNTAYLYTKQRGGIGLKCLVPLNRTVLGTLGIKAATLHVWDVAGILSDGRILATGGLDGDGKSELPLLFTPLPKAERGRFYDFCPRIVVKYFGRCGSSGEEAKRGDCEVSVSVGESGELYKNIDLKLTAIDVNSTSEKPCPQHLVRSFTTGEGIRKFRFTYQREFEYSISFAGTYEARFSPKNASIFNYMDSDLSDGVCSEFK